MVGSVFYLVKAVGSSGNGAPVLGGTKVVVIVRSKMSLKKERKETLK